MKKTFDLLSRTSLKVRTINAGNSIIKREECALYTQLEINNNKHIKEWKKWL